MPGERVWLYFLSHPVQLRALVAPLANYSSGDAEMYCVFPGGDVECKRV